MAIIRLLVAAIFCCLCLAAPVLAQSWPQRTVHLIVPLPPGTAVDVSARLFAEYLSARWKQPVIVENIAGADGIIAAKEFVGRRDDHTLMYSFAGLITINPLLYEKLPYDPARDLEPIAMSSENFLAIAASAKLQVDSLDDLVKLARSRSAKLNWAATAGLTYFAYEGFLRNVGIEMVYVPYRDFNPALSDLGQGRIEVASAALNQLLPQSQVGQITLLAVLNKTRSPLAPNVPTAAEAGYPDLAFDGVTGFFGWRDMSPALRDSIAADIRAVGENPSLSDRLPPVGIVVRTGTPGDFSAVIEVQRAKVAAIAAAVGTKPAP